MMAALTVTGRVIGTHGRYRRETGLVTPTAWDTTNVVETKLGRVHWFKMQSVDGTAVGTLVYFKNYTAGLVKKNGSVCLASGGQTNGYVYEAIGV